MSLGLYLLWVMPIWTIILKNYVLGAVSPLSHAITDHCALHCILSMYSSGSYFSLEVVYVLSLGLAMISVYHFSLSHLNRQHESIFHFRVVADWHSNTPCRGSHMPFFGWCKNHTYHLHSATTCPQTKFFVRALQTCWKIGSGHFHCENWGNVNYVI